MKTQVICLDSPDVFTIYKEKYGLDKNILNPGLLGIELRDVPVALLEVLEAGTGGSRSSSDTFKLLLTGSLQELMGKAAKIMQENKTAGKDIWGALSRYSGYEEIKYSFAGREFSFNNCYVMGILNVTPDSFSDGGVFFDQNSAVSRALEMIDEGADIIDIGGESTRPGAEAVSEEEELKRVIPVIKKVISSRADAVISVDTTKSTVAVEALKAGASIVNDISGLVFDQKIAEAAAEFNAGLVVMHIKGTPGDMQKNPHYDDLVPEIYDHLFIQSEVAKSAGVKKIFIDPGIGFGKKMEHNFELIKRLKDFKSLGYPILTGVSRKSFIGNYLELPPGERDTASSVLDLISVQNGAKIIRTHNVKNGTIVKKLYQHLS